MDTLIIGGTGYIGEYLFHKYQDFSDIVKATSRNISKGMIPFDIKDGVFEALSNLFPEDDEKHAIVCAAETRMDKCKTDWESAYNVNVTLTQKLFSFLKKQGYHIIFCSTDSVFEGVRGNYNETDNSTPVNAYGKMKAEMERYILDNYPKDCIVRLSKVIGRPEHKRDMLAEWKSNAAAGKEIFCIRGNYFSPVYIDDMANCFRLIMERDLSGIYHICGNRRYARVELCREFLRKLSMDAKVSEKDLEEFSFRDIRPLDTSMNNDKFCRETGYKFTDLENIFSLY